MSKSGSVLVYTLLVQIDDKNQMMALNKRNALGSYQGPILFATGERGCIPTVVCDRETIKT